MAQPLRFQLEEKLKLCKRDLQEKDELISELSGIKAQQKCFSQSAQSDVGDLTQLHANVGSLCSKAITQKDEIVALKSTLQTVRSQNARLQLEIEELKRQLDDRKMAINKQNQKILAMESEIKLGDEKAKGLLKEIQEAHLREAEQQKCFEHMSLENKKSSRLASNSLEKFKGLVEWMRVMVSSTKSTTELPDECGFSDEAVQNLKTKMAATIVQARENISRTERLKSLLESKEQQIANLKSSVSSQHSILSSENKSVIEALELARIKEKATEERIDFLEAELEDAREQFERLEKHAGDMASSYPFDSCKQFRKSLSDSLNRSGWICTDEIDNILEVVRRVLTTLKNKTEAHSRLESLVDNLTSRLASSECRIVDADHKIGQLEEYSIGLREKLNRSPSKSVGFSSFTTDLEGSNEKLLQFLKDLCSRLPVEPDIHNTMSIHELRTYILEHVSQWVTPLPSKSECDLAPKLLKRVQRLQNQLASRDLQLQMWRQKGAKLEEQLAIARKSENDATEKFSLAEQRISRYYKNESELARQKELIEQLSRQLKESSDTQVRSEERMHRMLQLEETVKNLEDIRQRQAVKIGDLITSLETEKATSVQRLLFHKENQHDRFNEQLRETNQALDDLRRETTELREFRELIARVVGLRMDDLAKPNKEIVREVVRLLRTRTSPLSQSATFRAQSVSPGGFLHSSGARMGLTTAFSDSDPVGGPIHRTDSGRASSSLRVDSASQLPAATQQSSRDARKY